MKKLILSGIIYLITPFCLRAQNGITFKVEKLSAPKVKVLATQPYDTILKTLIAIEKAGVRGDYKQLPAIAANIVAKSKIAVPLISRQGHAFFDGIYTAYADHHPITLSPDMIWLVISQGFAQHVNKNAEELRKLFVDFEGKKELLVESRSISLDNPDSPWEEAFAGFDEQIGKYTSKGVAGVLTSSFSTTTAVSKVASQITMMNALKPYFDYRLITSGCGIPEVTLEGTPADWESVLTRAQALRKYKLDWWIKELEPILKQFVAASKGKASKSFWRDMVRQRTLSYDGACGSGKAEIIDGWIVKFYPYNNLGEKNGLKSMAAGSGQLNQLPTEVLKVDLKYVDAVNAEKPVNSELELYAGFVGLEQRADNYGLKPVIGWMVRKKDVAVN